ncbi:MAG: type IV secretion system protein [Gammaproteobacteria bacterium]|nr:type IV secretion system protein [Gammaproteobacteria bacterium]
MALYSTLVEEILTEIDVLLDKYVVDGYQALAGYLEVPLGVAIVFFFVCYGIALTQGWVKGSMAELTKSIFKIGMIYYLGMNWGHFSDYVIALFYDVSSDIGDVLVSASPIELPTSGGEGINGALQSILTELLQISEWVTQLGSWTNWMPIIEGVAMGVVAVLLVGFAILEMIIAKCMLSILFVLAPLFIAFTLFKSTQSFFDRWLGACVGYAMLMIFICAGLGLVVALDQWSLADIYENKATGITAINAGVLILVTFVCFGILKRISLLAMSIGGSITSVSGSEMFASAVGGAMGGLSAIKSAANILKAPFRFPGNPVIKTKKESGINTKDTMRHIRQGDISETKD